MGSLPHTASIRDAADRIRAKDHWTFADLVVLGIVNSRSGLSQNIRKNGFPSPTYLGKRTAVYPADEVRAWVKRRRASAPIVPPQLAGCGGEKDAA